MPTLREIRRRIRSIQSTAKITKAMEMVAASKMRRAQQRVLAARPYAQKITEVIADLASQPKGDAPLHPLLEERPVERILVVHVTADRGLCGGLNANMNRRSASFLLEQQVPVSLVVVGRKGRDYMIRYGRDVRAEFIQLGDYPGLLDTLAIARVIIDDYVSGELDRVYLAYTQFVNTAVQRPVVQQILPVQPAQIPPGRNVEYLYEPSSEEVLAGLLPRFVEMQVYHAVLEHIASEQPARVVAMRSAPDTANDLTKDLTLSLNKARQAAITNELLDLAGGAEAMKG